MRVVSLLPLSALLLALGVSRCVGHAVRHGDHESIGQNNEMTIMQDDVECDDGETNLEVDWDGSPEVFTCTMARDRRPADPIRTMDSIQTCVDVSGDYLPQHICMNETIEYSMTIPLLENHRPVRPVDGEYLYLPPQRWLHNIEHGAIVMLYHPCADSTEVDKLKQLVRGCIRRHIITPYNKLSLERPLALATWGCHLRMARVDEAAVRTFIREKALRGPGRQRYGRGRFDAQLLVEAATPEGSDQADSVLCPNQP
ncbi:uncharacterized protein LOC122382458 isoform X1 [Amphibalanus amphitrite]|uniref:uncharacterized protein LOC122382458 isoform X1 n=1 Tax=Amphibalanus amphitrite TaxID=1232801 RepID=UPI001C91A4EA|nr:uncharacterized protein LOC122382458 isoform X1 [Amphibalanus amphitrite]